MLNMMLSPTRYYLLDDQTPHIARTWLRQRRQWLAYRSIRRPTVRSNERNKTPTAKKGALASPRRTRRGVGVRSKEKKRREARRKWGWIASTATAVVDRRRGGRLSIYLDRCNTTKPDSMEPVVAPLYIYMRTLIVATHARSATPDRPVSMCNCICNCMFSAHTKIHHRSAHNPLTRVRARNAGITDFATWPRATRHRGAYVWCLRNPSCLRGNSHG